MKTLVSFVLGISLFALDIQAADKKIGEKNEAAKAADASKGKTMYAIFDTNMGHFKVKLFDDKAPKTVANFVGLAEGTITYTNPQTNKKVEGSKDKPGARYYDGVVFHRIIDGFMIQGGDPTGTGTGGPGFTIKDEVDPSLHHDKPGKLSMAKTSAPDSAGSQFFITVGAASYLDGTYTQFGEVVEGMDVVTKISKVETNRSAGDRPLKPVTIKTIKIERK